MPADRFALAVFIGREEDLVDVLEEGAELGDLLLLLRGHDVERLEIVLDVDAEPGPLLLLEFCRDLLCGGGEITDVSNARLDDIAVVKELRNGSRLRRRLHDDERLAHLGTSVNSILLVRSLHSARLGLRSSRNDVPRRARMIDRRGEVGILRVDAQKNSRTRSTGARFVSGDAICPNACCGCVLRLLLRREAGPGSAGEAPIQPAFRPSRPGRRAVFGALRPVAAAPSERELRHGRWPFRGASVDWKAASGRPGGASSRARSRRQRVTRPGSR